MALAVTQYGVMREGGGCLFVAVTDDQASANRFIRWTLTGNGLLVPLDDYSDGNGVATAIWSHNGALTGDPVTVAAEYHT